MPPTRIGRRVAIIAGVRTPFARAGTLLKTLSAIELGRLCVAELVQRTGLAGEAVDALVFGTVVPSVLAPNIAREVSLIPHLPKGVQAYSVSRACASANQAITDGADQIALGHADVVIAGGAESLSNVPILHSRGFSDALVAASRAKTLTQRVQALARLRPRDLIPITPTIAEPSTGESMGQSAEKMAKINAIPRAAQDALALASHHKASAGTVDGRLTREVAPVWLPPRFEETLVRDNGIRADATLAALAALKPVFDTRYGSVTAGNASPLTDGAAAIWVAQEQALARLPGHLPRVKLLDYEIAGVDIFTEGLLMAPAYAIPRLLARHNLALADIDLWEIHEAFAAQVLCNVAALESEPFLREKAKINNPLGKFPWERLNPNGGSVAIGHPFGATGARILSQATKELAAMGPGKRAIVSICADGGLGTVALLQSV